MSQGRIDESMISARCGLLFTYLDVLDPLRHLSVWKRIEVSIIYATL